MDGILRRRGLMTHEAESEIPLNVNLNDSSQYNVGFYDNRKGLNKYYTQTIYNHTSFRGTLPLPYDSRYTFALTGAYFRNQYVGLGLDENLIAVVHLTSSTYANIQQTCVDYETQTGTKIKYVCFSYQAASTVTWIRTA